MPAPPESQITWAFSGDLFTNSQMQNAAFFLTISSGYFKQFNNFWGF